MRRCIHTPCGTTHTRTVSFVLVNRLCVAVSPCLCVRVCVLNTIEFLMLFRDKKPKTLLCLFITLRECPPHTHTGTPRAREKCKEKKTQHPHPPTHPHPPAAFANITHTLDGPLIPNSPSPCPAPVCVCVCVPLFSHCCQMLSRAATVREREGERVRERGRAVNTLDLSILKSLFSLHIFNALTRAAAICLALNGRHFVWQVCVCGRCVWQACVCLAGGSAV